MQSKNSVYEIMLDLKKKIPSFYSIPVQSKEEKDEMDSKGILGALVIQDGEFRGHTVILKRVELKDDELEIEYHAVNDKDEEVLNDNLNEVVGNLINYFLSLEALKEFDNHESLM